MSTTETLPRWDVSTIYPSLQSEPYDAALHELDERLDTHEARLDADGIAGDGSVPSDDAAAAKILEAYLERCSWLAARLQTLRCYVYAFTTTDSRDTVAKRRASELDARSVRAEAAGTRFRGWAAGLEGRLDALGALSETIERHRFTLEETIEDGKLRMSEPEELLAADLASTAASAWSRLHGVVSSQIEVPVEVTDGTVERLPMTKVRALASDGDPELRRRAHEAELEAWLKWREPLAASFNGIKGWVNRLNDRRGYAEPIDASLRTARIDRATLDALLEAMKGSLPTFRRYFRAKATLLGKPKLDWWDIAAPVGGGGRHWSFEEASSFIEKCFGTFSPRLAAFARRAFDGRWIDAEPRDGKVGGAFCMGIPEVKESRILANFDGSFDQLSTIAHELGHGFHNDVLADVEPLRRKTPMTLAETASIFCETIVFRSALAEATDDAERLGVLETYLLGASQVVVDIYSRYLFETRAFEARRGAELSAEELCSLMTGAQRDAYGDGLSTELHPYMWAVKPHYYSAGFSFYNYPYAFGLLFGLGLYAVYRERGEAFIDDYAALLGSTGLGPAAELAARFDIDIRTRAFWDAGLGEIEGLIGDYETLAAG